MSMVSLMESEVFMELARLRSQLMRRLVRQPRLSASLSPRELPLHN